MRILLFICCLITPSLASVRVATVDMADLVNNDSVVVALQQKIKAKNAEILAQNKKDLEAHMQNAQKSEALIKKLEHPNISKKEKDRIRRELLATGLLSSDLRSERFKKLKSENEALNREVIKVMRKVLFRLETQTQKFAKQHKIDLLLDQSAKGKNQRLVLIYAASELNITEQFKGAKDTIEKSIEVKNLRVATINLNQIAKKLKPESIIKAVTTYAKKNGIHLVFDSSAESTTYSQVIPFSVKTLDITTKIAQELKPKHKNE